MRANKTVGWHTFSEGAATGRNTATPTYTPSLDEDGTSVAVYGWAPTGVSEPDEVRTELQVDLLMPPGSVGEPRDVVDLPSGQFEVVGHPEDFSNGPYGSNWGAVVRLKRIER